MKKNTHYLLLAMMLLLSLLWLAGCEENTDTNTSPTDSGISDLPDDPGTGNLAGKVVGTIYGQPLGSVLVRVGSRSTQTGSDGTFRVDGVGSGTLAVQVSGASVYTRTVAVNTNQGRSVGIDAIEVNSSFNLGFYRELARGNHPSERQMLQTHRWVNTTPPTVYIDTNAAITIDKVIDQQTIDSVANVISQVVPVFTGNFYTSLRVETRAFAHTLDFSDIPANSIVISFDDTTEMLDAYGVTFTEPDFTAANTSTINKAWLFFVDEKQYYTRGGITQEEVVAHELGHAFGFRHTSKLPSVMVAVGTFGGLYGSHDQLHMRLMYRRTAGNTDIDNDPQPNAKMAGSEPRLQVFVEQRDFFPHIPELSAQIRELEPHTVLQRHVPGYTK